jgi:uncharacterized OB-fold protein
MSTGATPQQHARGEERIWFEAAGEGWLALGHCRVCSAWFLPRVVCPKCWSQDVEVLRASGRGEVHSFTIVHRAALPSFADRVPYVVALIETDEGVRVLANLVGVAPSDAEIGMKVQAVFEDHDDGVVVPEFGPAA